MRVKFSHRGNFDKTEKFLRAARENQQYKVLTKYAEMGVKALAGATPVDTGLTADSWRYRIEERGEDLAIVWYNENDQKGYFNVALGLQLGHGTGTGGWVEGIDYINPVMKPVFDDIAEGVWAEIQGM